MMEEAAKDGVEVDRKEMETRARLACPDGLFLTPRAPMPGASTLRVLMADAEAELRPGPCRESCEMMGFVRAEG